MNVCYCRDVSEEKAICRFTHPFSNVNMLFTLAHVSKITSHVTEPTLFIIRIALLSIACVAAMHDPSIATHVIEHGVQFAIAKEGTKREQSTPLTKKRVAAKQKWRCRACGKLVAETGEIDQMVPLLRGGYNAESNMQALCRSCHQVKSAEEARLK